MPKGIFARLLGLKADGTAVLGPPAAQDPWHPGDEVVFIDESANTEGARSVHSNESAKRDLFGRRGVVVCVSNEAGKRIGVCLKEPVAWGHTCDGRTPKGHGVWTTDDDIYTAAEWQAHVEEGARARADLEMSRKIAERYLTGDPA